MSDGQHPRRDRVPMWQVHAILAFIALGCLWVGYVLVFA